MAYRITFCSLVFCFCVCLTLVIVKASEKCHENTCLGPLSHYRSLGCTPIIRPGACCPWQFNCDILYKKIRSRDKCYFNGRTYKIGEKLIHPDPNFCEQNCTCEFTGDGIGDFNCTHRDELCPEYKPSKAGCFQIKSLLECCSSEEYCLKPGEKRGTCKVGGRTYLTGELFIRKEVTGWRYCQCNSKNAKGDYYQGRCFSELSRHWPAADIHAEAYFYKKCAPIYPLDTDGHLKFDRLPHWRCQNDDDMVIDANYPDPVESKRVHGPLSALHCPHVIWAINGCYGDPDEKCRLINPEGPPTVTYGLTYGPLCQFGQLTMHIGDDLMLIHYTLDSCVICACEVPPVPTCLLVNKSCIKIEHHKRHAIFDDRWSFYGRFMEADPITSDRRTIDLSTWEI